MSRRSKALGLVVVGGLGLALAGCVAYEDAYYDPGYGGGYYGGYYGGYAGGSVYLPAPRASYHHHHRERDYHRERGEVRHHAPRYEQSWRGGDDYHRRERRDYRRD